jgi:hypothetical protein
MFLYLVFRFVFFFRAFGCFLTGVRVFFRAAGLREIFLDGFFLGFGVLVPLVFFRDVTRFFAELFLVDFFVAFFRTLFRPTVFTVRLVAFLRAVDTFRVVAAFRDGLRFLSLPLAGVLFLLAAVLPPVFRFFAAIDRFDEAGLMVREEAGDFAPIVRDTEMVRLLFLRASWPATRSGIIPGRSATGTRTASKAAILSAAVPEPPEIIAPACPMRLPGGAVSPAMNATRGLVTLRR